MPVPTPAPGESAGSVGAPDLARLAVGRARAQARRHAADLSVVARERRWLLDALARGVDIDDLAEDLRVTPRAICHLLRLA